MSVLLANIADSLLPHLLEGKTEQEKWEACAKDFPWYPMPWLALAKNGDAVSKQKAAVWVEDEYRLHWLLKAAPYSQHQWAVEPAETKPADTKENEPIKFTLGSFEEAALTEEEEDANDTDFVESEETDTAPLTVNLSQNSDNHNFAKNTAPKPLIETEEIAQNLTEQTATGQVFSTKTDAPNTGTSHATQPLIIEPAETGATPSLQAIVPVSEPKVAEESKHPATEALAFEPYHVVDYFASQGIKVDINDIPKTQLDRQMKSFTQWLKTMKRVAPSQDSTVPTDPVVDAQATSSLIKEDVITEAMAEVLEKQGMDKKAIEVYEKLILLHPEKSTFFAARIKDLKSK